MSVRTVDAVGNVSSDQTRPVTVDNVPPTVGAVQVTGSARDGGVVRCVAQVDGQTPRVAYQWLRAASDGSGESAIDGASEAAYTPSSADVGKKLLCEVTGTDGGGSAKRKSGITDGPFAGGAVVGPAALGGGSEVKVPDGSSATVAQSVAAAAAAAAAAVAPCKTGTVKSFGTVTKFLRSYNRSSVPLSGRLLGAAGEPRDGRTLVLTQTVVRAGTAVRTKVASVRTGADGSFKIKAPPGPSRALQLVDPDCGSVGPVLSERVRGALQARTTTRRVRNRQTARFRGRALGGYVGRGIPVELQVKVGRQWRDVKHTTTNSRGEYKVGYRFLRTFVRYTYRFRVVTRAGGAWPYMPATSRVVKVRVN